MNANQFFMCKQTLLASFIFLTAISHAQQNADTLKKFSASRIASAPKIDGNLDDDVWKNVNILSDFVMNRPVEGGTPTQKTEVKIVYDNSAIYVGAMMYDSAPDSILREMGLRDAIDPSNPNGFTDINADNFRIVIDPYNQRQDAFDFTVYASGVQADSKFSDYTFDAVWESKTEINSQGWCVEIKIPYSAIRFPKKAVQQWALQLTRNIRRIREFDQWCLTPSEAYNSQLFWGNLNGIENIKPPLRLSLTPYLSGSYERAPVYENDSVYTTNNAYSYRGGADLKYGLDERFTLDVTLLPDFSQVKSDNKIVTLGYQEITYDENRPFFKEGTELFAKNGLFYSRRIGAMPSGFYDVEMNEGDVLKKNPANTKLLNAIKLSGRTDEGLGIGLFNAITDNAYAEVKTPDGETNKFLTEPLTNFNIVVLDKQWKGNNSLYFINSNVIRDKKYDNSNVTATGFTFSDKKNRFATDCSFSVSQLYSKTNEPGSFSDVMGIRYFTGIRKINGRLQYGASKSAVDPRFDATDLGYYDTPNREYSRIYIEGYQFKPWKFIREGNTSLRATYIQHFQTKDRTFFEINNNTFISFLDYNATFGGFGFTPMHCREYDPRLNGKYYNSLRYWYAYLGISTDYRKALAFDITQNMSNFVDRFKMEGYNTDVRIRYRLNDHITLVANSAFYYDPFNVGYVNDMGDFFLFGGRKTHTYINQLTARYIIVNDMSVSINARHYWFNGKYRKIFRLEDDGSYTDIDDVSLRDSYNFNYNFFNVDFLFTWRFAPGSDINISYKNIYEPQTNQQYAYRGNNFKQNLTDILNKYPHTNNFSVKVIYYLDYLSVRKKR